MRRRPSAHVRRCCSAPELPSEAVRGGTHSAAVSPVANKLPKSHLAHVASKYVVARSVAKCLSDLRTVPVA